MTAPPILVSPSKPTKFHHVFFSVTSWIFFCWALIVLARMMLRLTAVGGMCASGGPYVIATECTPAMTLLMPAAILSIIGSVLIYAAFSGLWGPKLIVLFWPALFCTLGWAFIYSTKFEAFESFVGYLCGGVFLLMGGLPALGILMKLDYSVLSFYRGLDSGRSRWKPASRRAVQQIVEPSAAPPAPRPPSAGSREAQAAASAFASRLVTGGGAVARPAASVAPPPTAPAEVPANYVRPPSAVGGVLGGLVILGIALGAGWYLAEWALGLGG